jgi:hypothetical protein
MSRNPFLSTFEAEFNKEAKKTDLIDMSANLKDSPKKATFGTATEELFVRPIPLQRESTSDGRRQHVAQAALSAPASQTKPATLLAHCCCLQTQHGAVQTFRAPVC